MTKEATAKPKELASANELLVSGGVVGAIGAAGAVLAGAVCPVCVVATPLLIGGGVIKKLRESRRAQAGKSVPSGTA